jgi:hypothetical protein
MEKKVLSEVGFELKAFVVGDWHTTGFTTSKAVMICRKW